MPVTQTKYVANHGHDRETARVVSPALEPHLRVLALDPEHCLQVLTQGLLQCMLEYLHLVRQRADLEM